MNLEQLRKLIGRKVIADHQGLQVVGTLIDVRAMFGRVEGKVELPKGSRPANRWFTDSKITTP